MSAFRHEKSDYPCAEPNCSYVGTSLLDKIPWPDEQVEYLRSDSSIMLAISLVRGNQALDRLGVELQRGCYWRDFKARQSSIDN